MRGGPSPGVQEEEEGPLRAQPRAAPRARRGARRSLPGCGPPLVSVPPSYLITHTDVQYVEDYLFKAGLEGKACLLRAICETHQSPLLGYGLVGELLEMFLT